LHTLALLFSMQTAQISNYTVPMFGRNDFAGGPFYQTAVENVGAVGYQLAKMLDFMEKNSGPLKNLHLIGNNLGAHVMGVAASQTKVVRVPRITGEPLFASHRTHIHHFYVPPSFQPALCQPKFPLFTSFYQT